MGARSEGRESALQMLFAMEAGGGSAERVIAPGHVEAVRRGVPELFLPWHNPVSETYMEMVVGLGGGKNPSVRVTKVVPDGTAHGVRLAAVTFALRWTARGTG